MQIILYECPRHKSANPTTERKGRLMWHSQMFCYLVPRDGEDDGDDDDDDDDDLCGCCFDDILAIMISYPDRLRTRYCHQCRKKICDGTDYSARIQK